MNDHSQISKAAYLAGRTLLHVDAFGAVGDGIHDDAVAIRNCCEAAARLQKPAAVVFTAGKVYYADSLGEHFPWTSPWSQTTVIYFEHARDIVVEGNGCRLELGPSTGCFFNLYSEKLVYHNIIVDHRIPTFISGTVEEMDGEGRFLRVQTAYPMDENLTDGEYVFPIDQDLYYASPNYRSPLRRRFLPIQRIVSEGDCRYRVYPRHYEQAVDSVRELGLNTPWMWPSGSAGHGKGLICGMKFCGDVTFRNVEFQSGDCFMFYFQGNVGDIRFYDSHVRPNARYGTNYMTTGRDIFHCVDNRGAFIWENCSIWWAGDDFMNICDTTSYVDSVDGCAIKLRSMEFKGLVSYRPGDTLEAYDRITGRYYGTATVVQVEDEPNYLDVPFLGIEGNPNIRVNCPNLAAPNSRIHNCRIAGTGRFKGKIEVTDTYFDVQVLWLMQEGDYEGPIPKEVVFRNCVFDNGDIEIAAYDRGVPGSDFTEIGPLVDVTFCDCRFYGIHFVEKNRAAGKYIGCVFDNCTHGDKCRFEIDPRT